MAMRTSSGKVVLAGPGLYEVLPLEVVIGGPLELHGVHVDGEEQRVGDGARGGGRHAFGGGMVEGRRAAGGPALVALAATVGGAGSEAGSASRGLRGEAELPW